MKNKNLNHTTPVPEAAQARMVADSHGPTSRDLSTVKEKMITTN
jgi:hypothetical protein